MNLKFKSTEADLKFNIQLQLRQINQNILYLTRQTDLCVKWLKTMNVDTSLQQTVDKYFEEEDSPNLQSKDTPLEDMAQDGNSSSS